MGGVYISGTTPAKIYINGREQKLSNQDIATILRSLPPNSVEKIEIIRSPSTKYDAATTGGIINIVLKKGVKLGKFGSVNIGANQGYMAIALSIFRTIAAAINAHTILILITTSMGD